MYFEKITYKLKITQLNKPQFASTTTKIIFSHQAGEYLLFVEFFFKFLNRLFESTKNISPKRRRLIRPVLKFKLEIESMWGCALRPSWRRQRHRAWWGRNSSTIGISVKKSKNRCYKLWRWQNVILCTKYNINIYKV